MKIVIIGAGGQARIVHEIVKVQGYGNRGGEIARGSHDVVAFVDSYKHSDEYLDGVPVFNMSALPGLNKSGAEGAIVAIGDNNIRREFFLKVNSLGFQMVNVIHPSVLIAPSVRLGGGVTAIMGSMINTGSIIGDDVIINTGAIIDHDNVIKDHAHIGPGAILAGKVTIGAGTWIGMGVSIKQCVTIGANSIIGAGATVLKDIPDGVVAVGTPATVIKLNKGCYEMPF